MWEIFSTLKKKNRGSAFKKGGKKNSFMKLSLISALICTKAEKMASRQRTPAHEGGDIFLDGVYIYIHYTTGQGT